MTSEKSKFLQPCKPDDFYGSREIINNFTEQIGKIKQKEENIHSFLIIGDEGTGKSSLLSKLSTTISGRSDLVHVAKLIPEEDELLNFFKMWKNKIDELSPDWRSLLEKVGKKRLGDDLPQLNQTLKIPSEKSYTDHYVELFFDNLDKLNVKLQETNTFLYFFFDNLQLFNSFDLQEFYPIFSRIVKGINERKYNFVIVATFNEKYLYDFDYEKNLTEGANIIRIAPLTASEAEIYLRRKAPMLINKGILELITNCHRSFFDLNLGIAFISSDLQIEDFVERNIRSYFELSDDEEAAFIEMASYNENAFPIEQLTVYVSQDTLKSLEEKGILVLGSQFARLVQDSLLTAMKFRLTLFGPLPTLMVQLDSILNDLENHIAPSDKIIGIVENLTLKIRDRLADFAIAAKLNKITKICIEKEMYQRAYDFAIINAHQFEQINELEQAGGVCESIAREFEERNYYFAAKLYVKSAHYYDAVEEDLKAKRSYSRASDQFEKMAMSLPVAKNEYAVRGYLKWSLDCNKNLGDKENFERIRKKATDLFDPESIHHNYFKTMIFKQEELVVEPTVEPIKEEIEEISLENIEEELEF
ncbi:MAG: ATP-binding protein [Candidatus Heimdallarchaeaceae archaeon]